MERTFRYRWRFRFLISKFQRVKTTKSKKKFVNLEICFFIKIKNNRKKFGFSCRYSDEVSASTSVNIYQNELNNTDNVEGTYSKACKITQYSDRKFEIPKNVAFFGDRLYYETECTFTGVFNEQAQTNIAFYVSECIGGHVVDGTPMGFPVIQDGCYNHLLRASSMEPVCIFSAP